MAFNRVPVYHVSTAPEPESPEPLVCFGSGSCLKKLLLLTKESTVGIYKKNTYEKLRKIGKHIEFMTKLRCAIGFFE